MLKGKGLRILLSLGLLLGLTAGSIGGGSAHQHDAALNEIYFPWVPNGAMLGESGPYFGTITIQNLEEEQVSITATPLSGTSGAESPSSLSVTVGGLASFTLTNTQLAIPAGGAGVKVTAERVSDGLPGRIAGVQKQAASESPSDHARTSEIHSTVGGYSALTETTVSDHVVLPIVQTNSEWNTVIRVTNFDETLSSNTVRVALREAGGGSATSVFTEVLAPGQTGTFDLLARGVPPEWVGSADITADGTVGAIAERVKPSTSMLIMNTSRQQPDSDLILAANFAPLILREWNHWNTGISLVNVTDRQNPVTIDYYSVGGEHVDTNELTLAPGEMNFIYTPASVESGDGQTTGFVGSARISSAFALHGAVDQVKYFGDDDDTGHAMSYMLEPPAGSTDSYRIMPLVQKGDPGTGLGDTTGIQLFNYSPSFDAMVEISYLDQLGNPATSEPRVVTLEPFQGYTAYTMFEEELPSGFQGSALIKVLDGLVVSAANNVNYAAQYDGSASFNLFSPQGVLQPQEIVVAAQPNPVSQFADETTLSMVVNDAFGRPLHVFFQFGVDDFDVAGIVSPNGGLSPVLATQTRNGEVIATVRLQESAAANRPVTVVVNAFTIHYDLEEEISITFLGPPELAPPDFSSAGQ